MRHCSAPGTRGGAPFGGAGTLRDVVLWRDDFEGRKSLNEEKEQLENAVDRLMQRAWKLTHD